MLGLWRKTQGRYACFVHDGQPYLVFTDLNTLTRPWISGSDVAFLKDQFFDRRDLDPLRIGPRTAIDALLAKVAVDTATCRPW